MPNTYSQLREAVRIEAGRLTEERRGYWYGARDLASPNDVRRIDHRRELLVEIEVLIDKYQILEQEI